MMKNLFENKAAAQDVTSHEVTVLELNTNTSSYTRLGWVIVLVGVAGFLLWATLAPLDKGVPIMGTVTVEGNRKAIQHQTGGTVDEILVNDGDVVKAGQPLVRMNAVQVQANAEVTRAQYYTARAVETRLIAERDGKKTLDFPEELLKAKSDPRVANNLSLQQQLFSSRQNALQSELGAVDENVAGLKLQTAGLEESLVSKKQQLDYLKEQLTGMRDLTKDGYVARNRLLDLERTYAQINGSISEDIGNIGRAKRQVMELTLRRQQRQQEYQKEVRSQLSDIQKESEALASRLSAQDFDISNVLIKAPVDGTIVGINIFTKGGVVAPGFKMMDIVPSDEPLIVEGQIPVNLIDKVHKGLKVELIFSAFNSNKTPHIPGIVTQVSADRFTEERTGQGYYKMKAQVAPEGMKLVANLQVKPGMPVEVFVKTGERSMMSYMLKPVFDRAKTSMTEE